jgi:hypothetical protein
LNGHTDGEIEKYLNRPRLAQRFQCIPGNLHAEWVEKHEGAIRFPVLNAFAATISGFAPEKFAFDVDQFRTVYQRSAIGIAHLAVARLPLLLRHRLPELATRRMRKWLAHLPWVMTSGPSTTSRRSRTPFAASTLRRASPAPISFDLRQMLPPIFPMNRLLMTPFDSFKRWHNMPVA